MIDAAGLASIRAALPLLAQGLAVTVELTVAAIVFAAAAGTLLAFARLGRLPLLGAAAAVYVNLFRSLPLVMVILWFYLLVPQVLRALFGTAVGDIRMASAFAAFALFEAAFYAEIIRAGLRGVPAGQLAAALALGLPTAQAMRRVVLPQALRKMLPLLLTQAIILFQDTSLVYVIGLADFFGTAYRVGDRDGRLVELLLFAGAVYFIVCLAASRLVRRLQRRAVR